MTHPADRRRAVEAPGGRLRRATARLAAVGFSVSLVACAGGAAQEDEASACAAAEPILNPTVEEMLGDEPSYATTEEVMAYASVRINDVALAHRLSVDQVAYVHAMVQADDDQAIEHLATRAVPELVTSPEYRAATSTVQWWLREHCAFAESWDAMAEPIPRSSGGFCDARAALAERGAVRHPRELDVGEEATREAVRSLDDHAAAAGRDLTHAYRFAAFACAGLGVSPSRTGEQTLREALSRSPYSDAHEELTALGDC